MTKRLTNEEFIERCISMHGSEKYDYSNTAYKTAKEKVEIYCNTCKKTFSQAPFDHASTGQGCPKCGLIKRNNTQRMTKEEFILRAEELHGKGVYDYSESVYVSFHSKLKIRCIKHDNTFLQSPANHLHPKGCRLCANDKLAEERSFTKEMFVTQAKSLFGNRYNYSLVEYKNGATKVDIICNKHLTSFSQTPNGHLSGRCGCPVCSPGGFNTIEPASLYVISVVGDALEFTGFGITNNIDNRLRTHKRTLKEFNLKIEATSVFNFSNGGTAFQIESEISDNFKTHRDTKHLVGFKKESTDSDYATVVAFVQNYIAEHNNKQEPIPWQHSTFPVQQTEYA